MAESPQKMLTFARMKQTISYITLLSWLLLLAACGGQRSTGKAGSDSIPMRYAQLLTMTDSTAIISDPWQQGKTLQRVPLRELHRVVVFTTSHCQLMEYLGVADRIVGVCDLQYILIPDIQKRVKEGKIADCGNSMSPDIEKIIALKPDAIILSPFEGSGGFGRLEKLGIPIIQAADYMETSALGRAEWMRYYGRLLGCAHRADSLFFAVDSTYDALRVMAQKMPVGRSILTERKTGATWYTPGGQSTIAAIIRDANGGYTWADDKHSGSLPLSVEQIIAKGGQSDVWAFKYNGTQSMSKTDLLQEYHGYEALKAFQTGEIYECNTSRVPYFEEVSWRPDYLLREMIQLLHPRVDLGGLRYYRKIS